MAEQPSKLSGVWTGYVSGTNRTAVLVRLQQKDGLKAEALLFDYDFGPAIIFLAGNIAGKNANLRLLSFRGHAPVMPLDGSFNLVFDEKLSSASGNWVTDIGTTGTCNLFRTNQGWIHWQLRVWRLKLGWSVRFLKIPAYGFLIFLIAAAAMLKRIEISWQVLILLLLPAPFLFSGHIAKLAALLRRARVKKVGIFEFEQGPPTVEVLAPTHGEIDTTATPQQQNVAFNQLNQYFVLRTKVLLASLVSSGGVPTAEFVKIARAIAVPQENLDPTLSALIQTGCARVEGDRIVSTEWGKRYVTKGIMLLNPLPPSPPATNLPPPSENETSAGE